jgi:hypothetical protein
MVAREWKVSVLSMRHCGESETEARSRNKALYVIVAIKSMQVATKLLRTPFTTDLANGESWWR